MQTESSNDNSENLERRDKESRSELLPEQVPVLIHRWFPKGEGWAADSSLSDSFVDIVGKLSGVIKTRRMGDFKIKASENEWLVGTMREDSTTKNSKARDRNPFYLTVAVVRGPEPKGEKLDEIYRQLNVLPEAEEEDFESHISIGGGSPE